MNVMGGSWLGGFLAKVTGRGNPQSEIEQEIKIDNENKNKTKQKNREKSNMKRKKRKYILIENLFIQYILTHNTGANIKPSLSYVQQHIFTILNISNQLSHQMSFPHGNHDLKTNFSIQRLTNN